MTEQENSTGGPLTDAAAENSPAGAVGERPAAGSERRTDPSQPTPAANQRAGESAVERGDAAEGAVADDDGETGSTTHDRPVTGVHRPSAPSGEVAPA